MQLTQRYITQLTARTPRFDCIVLNILRQAYAETNRARRDARMRRQRFLRQIEAFAEDGKIAIVWSGRDCDGVSYGNSVNYVNATKQDVTESIDSTYEWADGPCSYYLCKPSEARELEYSSRDLTLEAFEEGHSHVIYD